MNDIEIPVKEATQKGYAIAKGGVRQYQFFSPRKQDQKGKGRKTYGKHIRHGM